MNEQDVLGAFLLVNNPIVLSEEETKDVQKAIKKLQQENEQLKEKIDKYENPEDMTLMMMWCTEKVKDENKQLKKQLEESKNLKNKLLVYNASIKGNWNKLKEYIKETKLKEFEKSYGKRYGKTFAQAEIIVCNMILDKIQELEGSDSNEFMD